MKKFKHKHMKNVGIYSGTFDPFHKGHLAFCLEALKHCSFDELYIIPEQLPRNKINVTHITRRVETIERMIVEYPMLQVISIDQAQFTVKGTLPTLHMLFPDARLTLLMGSDVINSMIYWPDIERLLSRAHIVVGLRGHDTAENVERVEVQLKEALGIDIHFRCLKTSYAFVTSSRIKHLGSVAGRLAIDFSA